MYNGRHKREKGFRNKLYFGSSIGLEFAATNGKVVGSNPTRSARFKNAISSNG